MDRFRFVILSLLFIAITSDSYGWGLQGTFGNTVSTATTQIVHQATTTGNNYSEDVTTCAITSTNLVVGELVIVTNLSRFGNGTMSVSDDASPPNTYTVLNGSYNTSDGEYVRIAYSVTTTAKSGATITTTHGTPTNYPDCTASRFTGSFNSNPLDKQSTHHNSDAHDAYAPHTGAITSLSSSNEVAVGVCKVYSGTVTGDAEYTVRFSSGSDRVESKYPANQTSEEMNLSTTDGVYWACAIASFIGN